MPTKKEDLPSTLKRSPKKVQDTYAKTLDSAHEQYDSEERAHRTAWDSVKHVAEKKGDHWELKDEKGAVGQPGREDGRGGPPGRPDGRRHQRQKAQEGALRRRPRGGHRRALEHEQGRAGQGPPEAQRPGERQGT